MLKNLFDMKMEWFKLDIGNKDLKSTTLHELYTYWSNWLPNILKQKFV